MATVFGYDSLNPHWMDHLEIESNVLCSLLLMTWIEPLVWWISVSSANWKRSATWYGCFWCCIAVDKSLIIKLKRSGLMTEPCGVPLSKECNSEVAWLTVTYSIFSCHWGRIWWNRGYCQWYGTSGEVSILAHHARPDQRLWRCRWRPLLSTFCLPFL
jgi:hypothetical protein